MNKEELSKEQRILRMMRKTLGSVVRDVTPLGGRTNPLSSNTIQEIKECFGLISERESELAAALGFDQAKPHYQDGGKPKSNIVHIVKPPKQ